MLCGGAEGITALCQKLHHILCEVPARPYQSHGGMGPRISIVYGHSMRYPITTIHSDARRASKRVKRDHGLNRHIQYGHIESLKHDLRYVHD
jgi:hypothetical protein